MGTRQGVHCKFKGCCNSSHLLISLLSVIGKIRAQTTISLLCTYSVQ